jgi:hypothetical protein
MHYRLSFRDSAESAWPTYYQSTYTFHLEARLAAGKTVMATCTTSAQGRVLDFHTTAAPEVSPAR